MNFHRHSGKEKNQNHLFIGLIDTSGSILKHWNYLVKQYNLCLPQNNITITFSKNAQINQGHLDYDLKKYGGEFSNTINGFLKLEELLVQNSEKSITVFYITDGQDNYDFKFQERFQKLKGNQNNQEINFLILGIGQEFNLKQALQLKNLYHNGDDSLKSYFKIKLEEEKEFIQLFARIKNNFVMNKKDKLSNQQQIYPWQQNTDYIYQGQYSFCKNLMINQNQVKPLQKEQLIKGVQNYINNIDDYISYRKIIEDENCIQIAQNSMKIIDQLLNLVEQNTGFNFRDERLNKIIEKSTPPTFYQIVYENYIKNVHQQIYKSYNKILKISVSNDVYKYNQLVAIEEILQKKVEPFKNKNKAEIKIEYLIGNQYKIDFQKLIEDFDFSNQDTQNENLKILKQNDFLKGIQLPLSYYEICKSLEVKGYPVMMKVTDLQLTNPWFLEIKDINTKIPKITTKQIFDNFGLYKYKQKNEKALYYNSVLPFYSNDDKNYSELFFSDLYQLILSNNVTKKADVKNDEAFIAFLGNCLIYNRSQNFNQELENDILRTILFMSQNNDKFMNFYQNFVKNPRQEFYLNFEENFKKYKIFNISKGLTALLLAVYEKKISNELVKQILIDFIFLYYRHGKTVSQYKHYKFNYLQGKTGLQTKEKIKVLMREQFKHFKKLKGFKSTLTNIYLEELEKSQIELELLPQEQYSKLYHDMINPLLIKKLITDITGKQLEENEFENIISLSSTKVEGQKYLEITNKEYQNLINEGKLKIHTQCIDRHVKPREKVMPKDKIRLQTRMILERQDENLTEYRVKIINNKLFDHPSFKQLKKEILVEFQEYFRKLHPLVLPISFEEFDQLIQKAKKERKLKKRFSDQPLELNIDNYLIQNGCMCQDCPYYLKPTKRLDYHYNIVNNIVPPRFHILIKQNYKETKESIYEMLKLFIQEEFDETLDTQKYRKSEKEFINMIEQVRQKYQKILDN